MKLRLGTKPKRGLVLDFGGDAGGTESPFFLNFFLAYPFYLFETERCERNIYYSEFVNHQFF